MLKLKENKSIIISVNMLIITIKKGDLYIMLHEIRFRVPENLKVEILGEVFSTGEYTRIYSDAIYEHIQNLIGTQSIDIISNVVRSEIGNLARVTLVEEKTHNDAIKNVITFSQNTLAIEIFHEEITWQTFIINGLSLTFPSGWYRSSIGGVPSKQVTIPSIPCIIRRLEEY